MHMVGDRNSLARRAWRSASIGARTKVIWILLIPKSKCLKAVKT